MSVFVTFQLVCRCPLLAGPEAANAKASSQGELRAVNDHEQRQVRRFNLLAAHQADSKTSGQPSEWQPRI